MGEHDVLRGGRICRQVCLGALDVDAARRGVLLAKAERSLAAVDKRDRRRVPRHAKGRRGDRKEAGVGHSGDEPATARVVARKAGEQRDQRFPVRVDAADRFGQPERWPGAVVANAIGAMDRRQGSRPCRERHQILSVGQGS